MLMWPVGAGASYLLKLKLEKQVAISTARCLLQLSLLGYLLARVFLSEPTLHWFPLWRGVRLSLRGQQQVTESIFTRCLQVPIFSVDNPALTGAWLLMMISASALEVRTTPCGLERSACGLSISRPKKQ